MNTLYKILLAIAIILAGYLWFTRPDPVDLKEYIKIDGKEYELLKKTRDTIFIDSIITITEYKPSPPKIITETVEIPADVDTLAILKDYYSKYLYNDTLQIETFGEAYITDVVTQNRIDSRKVRFDIKIPEITETIYVKEKDKYKVFLGLGGGFYPEDKSPQSFYGSMLIKTPKDNAYNINIGGAVIGFENTEIKPFVSLTHYWKIKFGKK